MFMFLSTRVVVAFEEKYTLSYVSLVLFFFHQYCTLNNLPVFTDVRE